MKRSRVPVGLLVLKKGCKVSSQPVNTVPRIDQIPISYIVPVPYPTMHHSEQRCAHLCSEWGIVGYGTGALWNLWDWSVMNAVRTLLYFAVVFYKSISPYPTGLLQRHWGNHSIAPVPVKQPWRIWVTKLCDSQGCYDLNTTKQSKTKPYGYFGTYAITGQ